MRALCSTRSLTAAIERFWPANGVQPAGFEPTVSPIESLYDKIEELSPQTESQRSLQAQALRVTTDMGHTRFLLFEQAGSSIRFHSW
jgi:hypothetical protein